jgi:hypothetical protein
VSIERIGTFSGSGVARGQPAATLPSTAAGDILVVAVSNSGSSTVPASLSGTSGLTWTRKANGEGPIDGNAFNGSLWWARATGDHSGQTVLAVGCSGSASLVGAVYRGCAASGDPFRFASYGPLWSYGEEYVWWEPGEAIPPSEYPEDLEAGDLPIFAICQDDGPAPIFGYYDPWEETWGGYVYSYYTGTGAGLPELAVSELSEEGEETSTRLYDEPPREGADALEFFEATWGHYNEEQYARSLIIVAALIEEEPEPDPPAVTTEAASSITGSEATLNGQVNPEGQATTYWFEYGRTEALGSRTSEGSAGEGESPISKSKAIIRLAPGTRYYFRLVAENATGKTEGEILSFTTVALPVNTVAPAITGTAQVGEELSCSTGTWEHSPESYAYQWQHSATGEGGWSGIRGATASTYGIDAAYEHEYLRCVVTATNLAGSVEAYSAATARVTEPPTASTGAATGVTATKATLNGTVNPDGLPTRWWFEYGPTEAYGSRTEVQEAGEGSEAVAVDAALEGLEPGTTYHYRLVAESEDGEVAGGDATFTPPVGLTRRIRTPRTAMGGRA